VIYAMFANVSVGALFLAGIFPGAVMALLMMATVAYFAHTRGWGRDVPLDWRRIGRAFLELSVVVAFPFVVWAGVQAGACMASAIEAVVEATAAVNASVSVSVEVSASVSASGSAQ